MGWIFKVKSLDVIFNEILKTEIWHVLLKKTPILYGEDARGFEERTALLRYK